MEKPKPVLIFRHWINTFALNVFHMPQFALANGLPCFSLNPFDYAYFEVICLHGPSFVLYSIEIISKRFLFKAQQKKNHWIRSNGESERGWLSENQQQQQVYESHQILVVQLVLDGGMPFVCHSIWRFFFSRFYSYSREYIKLTSYFNVCELTGSKFIFDILLPFSLWFDSIVPSIRL